MPEFIWLSPKAPPRGFREVPPGGFCVSLFLLVRDAAGRVLAGRYDPEHPELEARTGMDVERRRRYADGWTLPARHLKLGEPPAEAAATIAGELGGMDVETPRLLHAWAESYPLAMYPGETHHDLMLAYTARPVGEPRAPPWYREVAFVDPWTTRWARSHDDVLATLRGMIA